METNGRKRRRGFWAKPPENAFADHALQTVGKRRKHLMSNVENTRYFDISRRRTSNRSPAMCHVTIPSTIRQYIQKFNYPRDLRWLIRRDMGDFCSYANAFR